MNVFFSTSAIADLENIKEYYLEQGVPHIGLDVVKAIIEHIETLTIHPNIGRIVPEFNDKLIRELIHAPYRVVYLSKGNQIKVIRVWRSERLLELTYR